MIKNAVPTSNVILCPSKQNLFPSLTYFFFFLITIFDRNSHFAQQRDVLEFLILRIWETKLFS